MDNKLQVVEQGEQKPTTTDRKPWYQIPEEREKFLEVRHRARTDLLFLCNNILGWPKHWIDVEEAVHGPVIDLLQKFDDAQGRDFIDPNTGQAWYEPKNREPSLALPAGPRRRLILDPRAHLKTTVNVMGHSIQWILNFPDISILIIHAVGDKAEAILNSIKDQFLSNETFRWYFPEYVPWSQKAVRAFKAGDSFVVPNRVTVGRKEATINIGSLDKSLASGHWHVIKLTDIAEDTNMKTESSRANVQNKVDGCRYLLEDQNHWIDMEGTRYHFADPYGNQIRGWLNGRRNWLIHIRSAYKKKLPKGAKHTPEYMDAPYLLDSNGNRVPWWPKDRSGRDRFTLQVLEDNRLENEALFASQMLNNPADVSEGRPFPSQRIKWMPGDRMKQVPFQFKIVTVDTASTVNARSNSTVLTCGAWSKSGHIFIPDIRLDKMYPNTFFNHLFDMWEKHKPLVVGIEETEYTRGLKPAFENECRKRGVWPRWFPIKRTSHVNKNDRILRAFQTVFETGAIHFSTDLPSHVKDRLQRECDEFGLSDYNDLLDTLADLVQFSSWTNSRPRQIGKKGVEGVVDFADGRDLAKIQHDWFNKGIYEAPATPDTRGNFDHFLEL